MKNPGRPSIEKSSFYEVSLGEVLSARREKAQPKDYPALPYIGLEHIEPHTMKRLGAGRAVEMSSTANRYYKGDVLYSRLRPYLNKVYHSDHDGLCSSEFIVFPPSKLVDSEFLKFRLNSHDFVQFTSSLNTGDRPRVDFDQISPFKILLPSVAYQRSVVSKVEKLFSILDIGMNELKSAQAKFTLFRQSLLKAAVEGALTAEWRANNTPKETGAQLLERILKERRARWEAKQLAKFEEQGKAPPKDWKSKYPEPLKPDTEGLPELPEGWTWASVQEVGDVQLGRQRSPDKLKGVSPTPYIRAANITEAGINFADILQMDFSEIERDTFALKVGDVLLTEASGSSEHVGRPAIWKTDNGLFCFQNTVLRFTPFAISSVFAFYSFLAMQKLGVFSKLSGGVGINHLSAGKFSKLPIALPPLPEQKVVVALLEEAFTGLSTQSESINLLLLQAAAQRQNILKAAFSGQLVPQDPNDEPASVLLDRIRAERAAQRGDRKQRAPRSPKAKVKVA